MDEIPNMVNKINIVAKTGLYGSPKDPAFMNNVSKNYFTNVSSPIKAAAFAKFYKQYDKKSTPVYKPMGKLGGVTPIKKLLKSIKGKKGKKASPKEETDFKKAALVAKAAKEAYFLEIYGPNYKPPTKAKKEKKGKKSSIKMYTPSGSTSSSKSNKSNKSSKSSKSSSASKGSSATSVSNYQNSMSSASR